MKITIEQIRAAFSNTHIHRNGIDMDLVFEKGTQSNGYYCDVYSLVYYLIEVMSYEHEFKFNVHYLHSDGGIRDFMIMYNWNNYKIIISRELYMSENNMNFKSAQELCDWLNKHDEIIRLHTK